jgi:hypothetical protein
MVNLEVGKIINNAFGIGFKNSLSYIVNFLLWAITIWIPYLNIGTTIGLINLPAKMSKGQSISMVEIFNSIYRKRMGEIFLVLSFISAAVFVGLIFIVIPAIVISIAWSLAPLLVIDKEINPIEAINKSNSLTYGHKWTIFFGELIVVILSLIGFGIIAGLLYELYLLKIGILNYLGGLIAIFATGLLFSIFAGTRAYIYGTLTKDQ